MERNTHKLESFLIKKYFTNILQILKNQICFLRKYRVVNDQQSNQSKRKNYDVEKMTDCGKNKNLLEEICLFLNRKYLSWIEVKAFK